MTVDYSVPGIVPEIQQGTLNRCWAACTTMLVSWKENASYSIDTVIGRYGSPWIDYFNNDQVLPFAEVGQYFSAVGLKAEIPMNYNLNGWLNLLTNYGPLMVGLDFDAPNDNLAHLVVLTGVKGDETPNGTDFYFVEPGAGRLIHESWQIFAERYEASDPMQAPFQVAHWP
jgi:hypothetical protein